MAVALTYLCWDVRGRPKNSRGPGLPSQAVLGTECRMGFPAPPGGLREQQREFQTDPCLLVFCFAFSADQMPLTGNLVQNLWVSFPKYLQYYVSLPKYFYTFYCHPTAVCLK